jgi:dihydroxyacid dehydratase/phosphogluconate dehydratase
VDLRALDHLAERPAAHRQAVLHLDCLTVSGRTLGEVIEGAKVHNADVIRPLSKFQGRVIVEDERRAGMLEEALVHRRRLDDAAAWREATITRP